MFILLNVAFILQSSYNFFWFFCKFFEMRSWDCMQFLRCRFFKGGWWWFEFCSVIAFLMFTSFPSWLQSAHICLVSSGHGLYLHFMTVSQSNITFATLDSQLRFLWTQTFMNDQIFILQCILRITVYFMSISKTIDTRVFCWNFPFL